MRDYVIIIIAVLLLCRFQAAQMTTFDRKRKRKSTRPTPPTVAPPSEYTYPLPSQAQGAQDPESNPRAANSYVPVYGNMTNYVDVPASAGVSEFLPPPESEEITQQPEYQAESSQ